MARILIVEDDGATRHDVADRLAEWGHEIKVAEQAQSGLACILEWKPDVVLSDIKMPGETGYDLVSRVRQLGSQYADLIFLFMSSLATPGIVAMGIKIGADDYVTKPIDYNILRAKIDAHLRQRTRFRQQRTDEPRVPQRRDVFINATILVTMLVSIWVMWNAILTMINSAQAMFEALTRTLSWL